MNVLIPVSVGELLDKISILRLKQQHITDEKKLLNVLTELHQLLQIVQQLRIDQHRHYIHLMARLKSVNSSLWDLEDRIRFLTAEDDTGEQFIRTAQAIHQTNDRRMRVKSLINRTYNSTIVEEKSYKE
jgi:hypothetical protein